MLRRPTRRFAWIALLIGALALPGPAMMTGLAPPSGVDPFFLCKAGDAGAAQRGEAPSDSAPGGGHASGHDHCPLCLTPAPAALASDAAPAAGPAPAADPEFATPSGVAARSARALARVRARPPPAAA